MKIALVSLSLVMLPVLSGCLSPAPPAPTNWTIEVARSTEGMASFRGAQLGGVRVASVDVRAPYTSQRLAVWRLDGSLAYDAYNVFSPSPALLLRGAVQDALRSSGRFAQVVSMSSVVQTAYAMEVIVTELALDCRTSGQRTARVSVALSLVNDRTLVARSEGRGEAEAAGDYSAAFSTAFVRAMSSAIGSIAVP